MVGRSACFVVMSVKVIVTCCGSVQPIVVVEVISWLSCRSSLGKDFGILNP